MKLSLTIDTNNRAEFQEALDILLTLRDPEEVQQEPQGDHPSPVVEALDYLLDNGIITLGQHQRGTEWLAGQNRSLGMHLENQTKQI